MHAAHSWLVAQPLSHVHVHMGIQRGAQWAVVLQLGRKPEAGALFGGLDSYVLCLGLGCAILSGVMAWLP